MKYFAYGSNMLTERLQARVPSARNPVRAAAHGYSIRFHKVSVDHSGKCNIVRSIVRDSIVHGVLFDVADSEIGRLDRAEGRGCGYECKRIPVMTGETSVEATVYVAVPECINNALHPYEWYLDLVLAGAEQHSLPEEYVAALRAVSCRKDQDLDRETRLEAIRALEAHRHSKSSA